MSFSFPRPIADSRPLTVQDRREEGVGVSAHMPSRHQKNPAPKGLSGHQSARSRSCDWLTPPEWIKALGPFDLDPCASVGQPWKTAREMWTVGGLDRPEHGFPWIGLVWMNPPYGPPKIIEPWMQRMAAHNNGIACIPARTETACWFKYVWPVATSMLFVKGRPHFHYPITGERAKANSGAPIALIAYGREAEQRLIASNIAGRLVRP